MGLGLIEVSLEGSADVKCGRDHGRVWLGLGRGGEGAAGAGTKYGSRFDFATTFLI